MNLPMEVFGNVRVIHASEGLRTLQADLFQTFMTVSLPIFPLSKPM